MRFLKDKTLGARDALLALSISIHANTSNLLKDIQGGALAKVLRKLPRDWCIARFKRIDIDTIQKILDRAWGLRQWELG